MYQEVLNFWFTELEPAQWWQKDEALDSLIRSRFSSLHQQAKAGELFSWRTAASSSLAEIIILDQFSRNIFRGEAASFACDPLALSLAQTAIVKGYDLALPSTERSFLYLPLMHSESAVIHQEAVKLYEALGNPKNLAFEHKHKEIIDQFGRFPHRNTILGRESSPEEIAFLKQPNSGF